MDNISIRSHIINNFIGDKEEDLKKTIEDSIKENDEMTLPGMGVFFTLIWENADDELKDNLLKLLQETINQKEGN